MGLMRYMKGIHLHYLFALGQLMLGVCVPGIKNRNSFVSDVKDSF